MAQYVVAFNSRRIHGGSLPPPSTYKNYKGFMKIKLEIPDWVDDKIDIYILADIELFMKREDSIWYIKTERCSRIGCCCKIVPGVWPKRRAGSQFHYSAAELSNDSRCKNLISKGSEMLCRLGINRPFSCCIFEGDESFCNIRWKKLDKEEKENSHINNR